MGFPIISIKNFDSNFYSISAEIFKACQEWGFLIITDHDIPDDDIRAMFAMSRAFFNLPEETKTSKPLNGFSVGYDNHPNNSFAAEGMSFGLPAGQLPTCNSVNSWFDSGNVEAIEAFKAKCTGLALKLLSCFAVHLNKPRDFFEPSHNNHSLPGHALKLMKYPKLTKTTVPSNADQTPKTSARLTPHADWGSLTLLFTETPGLEIRDPAENWHVVPTVPGGVVVNIGDVLSFWSGRRLKSTVHRVSWEGVPRDGERFSLPFFAQPCFDTDLRPLSADEETLLDADPLTYMDYYQWRIRLNTDSYLDDGKKGDKFQGVNRHLKEYIADLEGTRA